MLSSAGGARGLLTAAKLSTGSGRATSNGGSDTASGASTSTSTSAASGGGSAAVASTAVAASVAAAAVAGAVASATPPPPPRATALGLLRRVVSLLRSNFLVVLLLFAVKDGVAFLLHRVTQRLTNHAAEVLLGTPISSSPGNPWWLVLDPAFIRSHPGYELLIGLFFLISLPAIIALNSVAFTLAALVTTQHGAAEAAGAAGATAPSSSSAGSPGGGSARDRPTGRSGVGASLHLPPDDPSAAALADLGIHALPTAPPPPSPAVMVTTAKSLQPSPPPPGEPEVPTASTIAAASSLSAAPPGPAPAPAPALSSSATTIGGTVDGEETAAGPSEAGGGPWAALQAAGASVAAVLPAAGAALRRVWWVDMQFNLRALPLQGLCLLVLPALWALPRLMRIQLALPAAVLEGRAGRDALSRSTSLMTSSLSVYGIPFATLLATSRMLDYAQGLLLVLIPPRWWREVVEVPLLIGALFLLVKAAVRRLQDLLPLAAYLELSDQEAEAARKLQQEVVLLHKQPDEGRGEGEGEGEATHATQTTRQQHKGNGSKPPGGVVPEAVDGRRGGALPGAAASAGAAA